MMKKTMTPEETRQARIALAKAEAEARELRKQIKASEAAQQPEQLTLVVAENAEEKDTVNVTQTSDNTEKVTDVVTNPTSGEEDADDDVVTDDTTETSDEDDVEDDVTTDDSNEEEVAEKPKRSNIIIGVLGTLLGIAVLILLVMGLRSCQTAEVPEGTETPGVTTEAPGTTEQPSTPSTPAFAIIDFENNVLKTAERFFDEDVAIDIHNGIYNIGEDKLVELIGKYDEYAVGDAIAQLTVLGPEAEMYREIRKQGWAYNPNAEADYDKLMTEADEAYELRTGVDPDVALIKLNGYDANKSDRTAIKKLITESGDMELLTWYNIKTEGYDLMMKQLRDTSKAEEYKKTVRDELVKSEGFTELLEAQLASGITVMDTHGQYTEDYAKWFDENYTRVIIK